MRVDYKPLASTLLLSCDKLGVTVNGMPSKTTVQQQAINTSDTITHLCISLKVNCLITTNFEIEHCCTTSKNIDRETRERGLKRLRQMTEH